VQCRWASRTALARHRYIAQAVVLLRLVVPLATVGALAAWLTT
jgi:hypothetical protein